MTSPLRRPDAELSTLDRDCDRNVVGCAAASASPGIDDSGCDLDRDNLAKSTSVCTLGPIGGSGRDRLGPCTLGDATLAPREGAAAVKFGLPAEPQAGS